MPASIVRSKEYRSTSAGCELPIGSRFNVCPGPVKSGQLALFKVRDHLIVGRWFPDFIVQPSRWIHISADVRLIGGVCDV
jgi:hypothetical protein